MPRTRRRGNPMVRIGVVLIIIGFGSAILHSATSYQFTYLMWADGAQPYVGIVLGLIGVALLAMPFIVRARQGGAGSAIAPGAAFAQPPMGGGYQGFPQQQPNNFGQQGNVGPQNNFGQAGNFPQPTGFAQPTAWDQQPGFGQQPPAAHQPPQFGQPPQSGQQQPGPAGGWPQQ